MTSCQLRKSASHLATVVATRQKQVETVDEAMDLYNSLCARAGHLGLLSEEIDPATGSFLGNYPQAFSHIGVIASGVNLARICWAGGSPHGFR
jgi:GH15 family glucan-1,4-alpha-glucosidase